MMRRSREQSFKDHQAEEAASVKVLRLKQTWPVNVEHSEGKDEAGRGSGLGSCGVLLQAMVSSLVLFEGERSHGRA